MGRAFLPLLFLLTACAEPRYAPPGPAAPNRPAAAGDCVRLPASGSCLRLAWEKLPTTEETGTLLVSVTGPEASGLPVTRELDGELRAQLWMPGMNHGSTPTEVDRLGPGLYRVREVYFIMPGAWEIRLQVWRDGELRDEGVFALEI